MRVATLTLAAALFAAAARAESWPSWRGPRGTGISFDHDFPDQWGKDVNFCWRAELPDRGNSSPIVWTDRIFITQATEKDHRRTVMCFRRSDGKLLWQSGVTWTEREPTNKQNPYCSASPVTDGQRVIAYFGSAGLYCYDMDGNELWKRDVGKVDSWQGSGSSPVIHQDLCILNAGPGTNAVLIACDKQTGDVVWRVKPPKDDEKRQATPADDPDPAPKRGGAFDDAMMSADPSGAGGFLGSWSTPLIHRHADRDELIVIHGFAAVAYEPKTGRQIWTCRGLPEQAFASPMITGDTLVATGHRVAGGGTRVTAIKLGGSGDVTNTHKLWHRDLAKDFVGSGAIANGHVFLISQFGTLACLELTTGKKVWEKRLNAQGSLGGSWSSIVLAGDRMLVPNQSGEVFIIRASPDFEVLRTNWAGQETTCSSLAISDGQVFLRTYKSLWCFGKGGVLGP
jgi:outer membrane protein assembly factor BamB